MSGPLEGIRILDLMRLLPGAFATGVLADLGADVIKAERPGVGDYMRWEHPRVGEESAHNWVMDRNKRSVSIDLKDPRGVEAFLRLAETADAVMETFRPGVLDRLGVGYEALRARNPRIVLCSLSGYGQDGPLSRDTGHDINYVGRAGILSITGTSERPVLPGVQIADLGGAVTSVAGTLAAIMRARLSGRGDHVDVAMTDVAFSWLSMHMGIHFADGLVPSGEQMLLNGGYPCYNLYECADGRWLTVGAVEEKFWISICRAARRPELVATHRDPGAVEQWRAIFRERPRDEWLALMDDDNPCVGPVNDFAEAATDPQLCHRQMVLEQEHPTAGPHRTLGMPIKLSEHAGALRTPPPRLGEHTRQLLAEIGYTTDEIGALLSAGVAAEPTTGPA